MVDYLRRADVRERGVRRLRALLATEGELRPVEIEALAWVEAERIAGLVARLSPAQRQVVSLRFWGHFSFAETARITGKSTLAARGTAHRAYETLRRWEGKG